MKMAEEYPVGDGRASRDINARDDHVKVKGKRGDEHPLRRTVQRAAQAQPGHARQNEGSHVKHGRLVTRFKVIEERFVTSFPQVEAGLLVRTKNFPELPYLVIERGNIALGVRIQNGIHGDALLERSPSPRAVPGRDCGPERARASPIHFSRIRMG